MTQDYSRDIRALYKDISRLSSDESTRQLDLINNKVASYADVLCNEISDILTEISGKPDSIVVTILKLKKPLYVSDPGNSVRNFDDNKAIVIGRKNNSQNKLEIRFNRQTEYSLKNNTDLLFTINEHKSFSCSDLSKYKEMYFRSSDRNYKEEYYNSSDYIWKSMYLSRLSIPIFFKKRNKSYKDKFLGFITIDSKKTNSFKNQYPYIEIAESYALLSSVILSQIPNIDIKK